MADSDRVVARPTEHPFAPYVRILGKGKTGSRSFTLEEAEQAMGMVMRGEVEDIQLGAFLMLLRVKEENQEELAGFVRAVRSHADAPSDLAVDLDWASYAGKKRQLPWYLLAALALADSGLRVFMHGAGGHTAGRVYSEGVLEYLGLPVARDWEAVRSQLAANNFAFMPLGAYCPPLQRIVDLRNHFGLRSPVHTLARLLNPTGAPYSMQSIFHPAYAESHQGAAQLIGQQHAAVFKGEAGEVELRPEADTLVRYVHAGELSEMAWPRQLSGRQEKLESLDLDLLKRVWRGEAEDGYGQRAITGTIAVALTRLQKADNPDEAVKQAAGIWENRNRERMG